MANPSVPLAGRPPLLVFASQTRQRANGGLASLTWVLRSLTEFRPVLVTQEESELTARWRSLGFEVCIVPVPEPARSWSYGARASAIARRLAPMLRAQVAAYEAVRRLDARVVHFNDSNAVFGAALGARAAGARIVVALRDTTGIERWRWRLVAEIADVVVTLSDDMRRRYEEVLLASPVPWSRRARLTTIPSIVETPAAGPTRDEARSRLGIGADEFAIGVIGAVLPRKRQLDLVTDLGRALPGFAANARLHFVGDFSPEADAYARRCADARGALAEPGRILFHGFSPDVDLWYRALDLVVVASDSEGLARSMIEALAHGTPVVSTDVCSAREVLEGGDCGRVVPVGDLGALTSAVAALATDGAERARLGSNGRRMVAERYGAAAVGRAYDALYRELAEDARRERTTRRSRSA